MKKFFVFLFAMFVCTAYGDTETIEWYVDGTLYDTTSCATGGDINLPTPPTKTNYTFIGWETPFYDFSTLDPSVGGTGYSQNASARTWTTTFPYGNVSGRSLCSATPGTYAKNGMPGESTADGQYCWCKATGYVPSGSNVVYEPTSSLAWVFFNDYGSASSCTSNCASLCGNSVLYGFGLRRAVFGITQ